MTLPTEDKVLQDHSHILFIFICSNSIPTFYPIQAYNMPDTASIQLSIQINKHLKFFSIGFFSGREKILIAQNQIEKEKYSSTEMGIGGVDWSIKSSQGSTRFSKYKNKMKRVNEDFSFG